MLTPKTDKIKLRIKGYKIVRVSSGVLEEDLYYTEYIHDAYHYITVFANKYSDDVVIEPMFIKDHS